MRKTVFRRKKIEDLLQNKGTIQLKKTLGAFDLILLGIGAIVGTGIFILPVLLRQPMQDRGLFFLYYRSNRMCFRRDVLF